MQSTLGLFIGAVILALLVWRLVTPGRVSVGARHRPMAPDDDADFLRRLGEQIRRGDDDDHPADG